VSERLPRTRAKLRIVLGSVLRPLGWKSAGARRWERNHGEFLQTVALQGSQWDKSTNYLNCLLWHRKLGGARPPSHWNYHASLRPGNIDARRAGQLEKALETGGELIELEAWQEKLEKLVSRVCLPWFDRMDSLDAVTRELRRDPYLMFVGTLQEAARRRRARKRRAA
jgi:hypothetical protein